MPPKGQARLTDRLSQLTISPFPPADVRRQLQPEEWESSLDAWNSIVRAFLSLSSQEVSAVKLGNLISFLLSYYNELAGANADETLSAPQAAVLASHCYVLVQRLLIEVEEAPALLLQWSFLADLSRACFKSESLEGVLAKLWQRSGLKLEDDLKKLRNTLIKSLDSDRLDGTEKNIYRLGPLLRKSPDVAAFLFTGSDLVDSLCAAFPKASPQLKKRLAGVTYFGLVSLTKVEKPNFALLLDHLYSLKSNMDAAAGGIKNRQQQNHLLPHLITTTPMLSVIAKIPDPDAARARTLTASLTAFASPQRHSKKHTRLKTAKGKGRALDEAQNDAEDEQQMHVHRMSLVTQVQDLFPDLGQGFVLNLLDEYEDNVEQVIGHLLEDTLPPHLAQSDRTAELPIRPSQPHPTPSTYSAPPTRRNIHDNDAFDRLQVPTSSIHRGRTTNPQTADTLLSDRSSIPSKSTILAALATFDLDLDEYDDTYDADDAAAAPDPTLPDPDETELRARRVARAHINVGTESDTANDDTTEAAVFRAYKATPELFARDAATRRSERRTKLRAETGMTDEALEGWAVMAGREPGRLKRLERRFALGSGAGGQRELGRTAWRGGGEEEDEEEGEGDGEGQREGRGGGFTGRGRARGRGRGRGGDRGGHGDRAEGSDKHGSQVARQRKEANKGSRANHSRREQRTRKMARAGMAG